MCVRWSLRFRIRAGYNKKGTEGNASENNLCSEQSKQSEIRAGNILTTHKETALSNYKFAIFQLDTIVSNISDKNSGK